MDKDLEAIIAAIREYGNTHNARKKDTLALIDQVVFTLSPDQHSQVIEQLANEIGVDESA